MTSSCYELHSPSNERVNSLSISAAIFVTNRRLYSSFESRVKKPETNEYAREGKNAPIVFNYGIIIVLNDASNTTEDSHNSRKSYTYVYCSLYVVYIVTRHRYKKESNHPDYIKSSFLLLFLRQRKNFSRLLSKLVHGAIEIMRSRIFTVKQKQLAKNHIT